MTSGEAALVALAIGGNVLLVPEPELFNSLLDNLITSLLPRGLGAKRALNKRNKFINMIQMRKENSN